VLIEKEGPSVLSLETKEAENGNEELDPWMLYIYSIKSPATKEKYLLRLGKFLYYIGFQGALEDKARAFASKGKVDGNWAFSSIIRFIQFQKDRFNNKEITAGTIRNYVKSIKLFCAMADITLNWDKITRGLPKGRRYTDDRAPTLEEIKKLCEYPDRRIKAIVYTMISSGIRVGAWDYLRWGNIRPIQEGSKIGAARIVVYDGEDDAYVTFITPSAYRELAEWMNYRKESGEAITDQSWIMRDLWDTQMKISRGLATIPKKLTSIGVKRLMERAIWAQGLRSELQAGKKRHPFATNHSLRKYFKTRCELGGMKPINIENLMGHSTGKSEPYYRPTENDLLQDYLKCVDVLSVNDERTLQKKVDDLANKSKDNEYIVNAKLSEKEKEIQLLRQRDSMNTDAIGSLTDKFMQLMQEVEGLKKKSNTATTPSF
jgi:integrase